MSRRVNMSAIVTVGGQLASSLGTAVGAARSRFRSIGSAIDTVEVEQRSLRLEMERYTASGEDITAMRRRYDRLGDSLGTLRQRQAALSDATDRHATNTRNRDRALTEAAQARGQLMDVAAVGAAIAAPTVLAASFEERISSVGATAGATAEEMVLLRDAARAMGRDSQYSANEAADALEFLAMAGFSVEDSVSVLPGVLDLAKAGTLELGEAADVASNVLSGMGLDTDQIGRVGDVLVNTATSSNTSVSMLGATMEKVAPVGAAMGVELEELAAMAGLLGDAGIQGSQAGTAMAGMLRRLVSPSGAAAAALEEMGVQTKDADGNLRSIPVLLEEINAATADMGSGTRGEMLQAVFGAEALAASMVLLEQTSVDGANRISGFSAEVAETGTAAAIAARKADNTIGDWRALQSAISDNAIAAGEHLLPVVRDTLGSMTQMSRRVSLLAERFPGATRAVVIGSSAIVGLTGALVAARYTYLTFKAAYLTGQAIVSAVSVASAGTMVAGIRAVGAALLTNPIGLTLTGIALAAGLIIANWEPIKAFAGDLWGDVQLLVTYAQDGIRSALDWEPIVKIREAWQPVQDWLTGMWDSVYARVSEVMGKIAAEVEWVGDAVRWFRNLASSGEGRFLEGHGLVGVDENGDPIGGTTPPPSRPQPSGGASAPAASGAGALSTMIDNINITTHAAAGQDERAIARATIDELMARLGMHGPSMLDGVQP